jgi:chromosomal replication initiator protein
MDTLWFRTLEALKNKVDDKNFSAWIKPLEMTQTTKSHVRLAAPNRVTRKWFIDNYLKMATEVLRAIAGREMLIEVELAKSQMAFDHAVIPPAEPPKSAAGDAKKTATHLPSDVYAFDNFVVGPSNEFAYAACKNVAKQPGQGMNPLFIYGGTGLGKTHLLNAVGVQLLRKDAQMRVVLVSAERFMNDLIGAIQSKRTGTFHKRYRNLDALLIDDIQTIAGKNATQEEFFHTFNALYENGAQIVLASDKYPRDIPMLEERLRSRFGMGMIADIQPPELETRMAIVKSKAALEKIVVDDEVAFFIASHITANIRELEGALRRAAAFSEMQGGKLTIDVAKRALRHLIGDPDRPVAIEQIQRTICDYYNVKHAELIGVRKHKEIAQPRQVAMYLARKMTNSSFPDIAKKFGNRDHTTVMHAVRKVETQSKKDPGMLSMLEALEKTLRNK